MIIENELIKMFCKIDDFCKVFEQKWFKTLIESKQKTRHKKGKLSLSEIMTIIVYFQISHHRDFKYFYTTLLNKKDFPNLVSYNRFVELMPMVTIPLLCFINFNKGVKTGTQFVDSTPIIVCNNKRIYSNKVFKNIATIGKSTIGWFFGFKLHIVINEMGELLSFRLTRANVDDRKPLKILTKNLYGKIFGDKGYISSNLFAELLSKGLKLVTGLKNNMKNKLMDFNERIMLRKRSLIESVYHILKDVCHIEHTRHRSPENFVVNILAGLAAYTLYNNKPKLKMDSRSLLPLGSIV